MPPSRYVFPEAEVYIALEDADSESDSDSDKDDLDDLSDIDGNSDPLNTSDDQMDRNNSCSDQDRIVSISDVDANNIAPDENVADSGSGFLENKTGTGTDNAAWQKKQESSECQIDSYSSKESGGEHSNTEIQYSLVTTSNELSDSLIDNMDHFAKIDKDETDLDRTDVMSQEFSIDLEGT